MNNSSAHHLSFGALEAGLREMARLGTGSGVVMFLVRRCADGRRATPERVRLTPEEGMPGDAWNRRVPRDPEMQLAVMRHDVATLIAHGQPLTRFGDNLFVDLDISAAALPTGARLRVGEALVEVTPKAHNGCQKFSARFGADAHRFVEAKVTRHLNLRGIYWRVIDPGEVYPGAPIQVVR